MKKQKIHITALLLLLFFVAGQVILFAHQHHRSYFAVTKHLHASQKNPVVQEQCSFCDQMHHAPIYLTAQLSFSILLAAALLIYGSPAHRFIGNTLVHADGLSPPQLV